MSKKDNKVPVKQKENEELTLQIAFLKLKAHGIKFAEISKIIGVSKSVLKNWDDEFGFQSERVKVKEICSNDARLKEKPKVRRTINSKLYGNGYYVKRIVVSKYLYLFNVEDVVRFEFNICEIETENPEYPFTEFLKLVENNKTGYYNGLERKDLKEELKRFFIDDKSQGVYFFNKVFHREKELPLYYGILYTGDANNMWEDNEKNHFSDFLNARDSALVEHIYSQKLLPSYMYHHFAFLHYYGDAINQYLQYIDEPNDALSIGVPSISGFEDFNYNYVNEELIGFKEYVKSLIAFTEYWEERLGRVEEPALKAYMRNVIDSFVDRLKLDGYCSRCQYCGKIISLKSGKKYCSLKEEGRDCGRSARNKRNYERRKANTPTEK